MKLCIMKPGPPAFCLVILEYLFPSPLFKCHFFAWELFEHRTWQLIPVLYGPVYKLIFSYIRPLPSGSNFSFMIHPAPIVRTLKPISYGFPRPFPGVRFV